MNTFKGANEGIALPNDEIFYKHLHSPPRSIHTLDEIPMFSLTVDDPLDAAPLHFAGGAWGMAAEGIFNPDGLLYQWSTASLLVNRIIIIIVTYFVR